MARGDKFGLLTNLACVKLALIFGSHAERGNPEDGA
jgi:hypothetical protein